MKQVRKLAMCAVLTALALGLSYAERFIPLGLVVPLPGIKLGLANVVTLLTLCLVGPGAAFSVLVARCFLGSLFAGSLSGLVDLMPMLYMLNDSVREEFPFLAAEAGRVDTTALNPVNLIDGQRQQALRGYLGCGLEDAARRLRRTASTRTWASRWTSPAWATCRGTRITCR